MGSPGHLPSSPLPSSPPLHPEPTAKSERKKKRLRFYCILQGVGRKCHPSRPPIPEEREVNRLHAEAVKKRKEAAEAAADRKRRRKERHNKACKIARAEGKPRPATPESTSEEEEDASDAEAHLPGDGESDTSGV